MDMPSPKPGRYLIFDFGTKRIGVAVGQTITGRAQPVNPLKAKDGIPQWPQIEALIKEWQPVGCVVGLPLNMDGTEQELTRRASKFAKRLHGRFGLSVFLQDERLSTVDARQSLFDTGGYRALNDTSVDGVAATIIFEDWSRQHGFSNT
ncbi:MAG: Holliday junction resolvase RuvX [Pseudomonadota bacterium]